MRPHRRSVLTVRHLLPLTLAAWLCYPTVQAQQESLGASQDKARRATEFSRRLNDPVLMDPGAPFIYRDNHLEAVMLPVGGIGAGLIQMNGKAEPASWQIFNNGHNPRIPDSFLAIRVKTPQGQPVVRALQTAAVGPFAPMQSLSLRGEYPFGWYSFSDPDVPVVVTLETFNPLIPLDAKNSAIPCVVYNVTVTNPAAHAIDVTVLAAQHNLIGNPGANTNEIIRDEKATLLHLTQEENGQRRSEDMVLMALTTEAAGTAAWDNLDALAATLAKSGTVSGPAKAGPSADGPPPNGALSVSITVPGGQTRTVSFVLAWYFPNTRQKWGGSDNMYANWWPSALGLARELETTLPELTRRTRLYHDTLYDSNLPHWLLDRIGSQLAVLRSRTCFWTRQDYFGGWEGCGRTKGLCKGNCTHVWHYAQGHARVFPSLARRMREQEFHHQAEDGSIPYRQPRELTAFDGQCGSVLNSYREHLMSADGAWLDANWPAIRKAMDYLITRWDKDEDGVPSGPQWNTLDGELGGSSSWLGSLYLAALAAAEKMAILKDQPDMAKRYARIRQSGGAIQDSTLFNGEYYIQIPEETPQQDYGNGCHIDQVLGQWWANQLDLGPVYPPDHVRTALGSLLRHNFQTDFRGIEQLPRKFVDDNDAGMQMITWPKGCNLIKQMQYASEVMSGFEYAAAANMIQNGMLREGLMVTRAVWERYDGRLRTNLTDGEYTCWGYSGNPFGDDECGKFYARALSVWSLLLACQGYVYDGPAGRIGFRPVWQPDNHASMFTAAEGWGLYRQVRNDTKQTARIEVREGKLRIASLVFRVPEQTRAKSADVRIGGHPVPSKLETSGNDVLLNLEKPWVVDSGDTVEIAITL